VLWDIALLIAGLAIIYVGGRFLIQGASSIALRLGMRPILVGVTIVAFGTSAPELFLALISSISFSIAWYSLLFFTDPSFSLLFFIFDKFPCKSAS